MERVIIEENKQERLDQLLMEFYAGLSRSQIKKMIESGDILVNDAKVKAGYQLRAGDELTLGDFVKEELSADPENIPLDIVYEDEDLAIINKPQGMVVQCAFISYAKFESYQWNLSTRYCAPT